MNAELVTIGKQAKQAATTLAQLPTTAKNAALMAIATALEEGAAQVVAANQADLKAAEGKLAAKFNDRLLVNAERIDQMAAGLRQVAALPDPTAVIDRGWVTPTGLKIVQKRVPLGVIGIIFEARPNVTVDAAGLTLKSGNAVILRGGKEALQTNQALVKIIRESLAKQGIDPNAVQLITDPSHALAQEMMSLTGYIDVLIPRGSQRLIQAVVQHATVPVIETGAGNCHLYVDASADLKMAEEIVVNAKVQRPSVCNAAEKLLVHRQTAARFLPRVAERLTGLGVELRGDERARSIVPTIKPASDEDWTTEYNDLIMAVKVVDNLDEAIDWINRYSTHHSESIITKDLVSAQAFQDRVDSACVYVNASTRFTDGFEFGFGAEIGISTQKLHARGPMGLAQLTTIKYQITGQGQVRE